MKTGLQLVAQEPRSILGRTHLLQKGLEFVTAGGRWRQEEGRSMTFQQAELRHYLVKIVPAGSGGDIIHVFGHRQGRRQPGADGGCRWWWNHILGSPSPLWLRVGLHDDFVPCAVLEPKPECSENVGFCSLMYVPRASWIYQKYALVSSLGSSW